MRLSLLVLLIFGSPAIAGAQSHIARSTPPTPLPSIGLPLPPIGLPLPQIGLPLPQMGLTPRTERPERSERPERPERPERSERSRHGSVILFVPAYGWPYLPGTAVPTPPSRPQPPTQATGRLHLDLQSGVDPQIYVDGYYVGRLSDVGSELTLDAGPHSIELREDGYENLRVDVQMSRDGLMTYRGALKPVGGADRPVSGADLPGPRVDAVPPAPTTIYVIPGCYVGNVPPKDAGLPAGCNERNAVAFPSRP